MAAVFVSHSSRDRADTERVVERLAQVTHHERRDAAPAVVADDKVR